MKLLNEIRPVWIEIDIDKIIHNYREARRILDKGVKICGVLKANAYGHGTIETAEALIKNGIDMLSVATLSEALEIRRHFSGIPILIMGYTPDAQLHKAVKNKITITLFDEKQAHIINELSKACKLVSKVHVKIDTGFHRLGINADSSAVELIERISRLDNLELEGAFSHLALKNEATDYEQWRAFNAVMQELEKKGVKIPLKHICDSIAVVEYPEFRMNLVRLGAFLYGLKSFKDPGDTIKLEMGLTFKARLSQIKEIEIGEGVGYGYYFTAKRKSLIGTLPFGYADGYPRAFIDKGEVTVRGKRAPVIGKICMDQCMVDLTDIPEAKSGDEVIILSDGKDNTPGIEEMAARLGTNKNELIAIISRRVPRVYKKNGEIYKFIDYLED